MTALKEADGKARRPFATQGNLFTDLFIQLDALNVCPLQRNRRQRSNVVCNKWKDDLETIP